MLPLVHSEILAASKGKEEAESRQLVEYLQGW